MGAVWGSAVAFGAVPAIINSYACVFSGSRLDVLL